MLNNFGFGLPSLTQIKRQSKSNTGPKTLVTLCHMKTGLCLRILILNPYSVLSQFLTHPLVPCPSSCLSQVHFHIQPLTCPGTFAAHSKTQFHAIPMPSQFLNIMPIMAILIPQPHLYVYTYGSPSHMPVFSFCTMPVPSPSQSTAPL